MKALYPGCDDNAGLGVITSPVHWGIPHGITQGGRWAGDLGCLNGPDYVKRIDLNAVATWLPKMEPYKPQCLWLAGGDIVQDAEATLEAYEEFKYYLKGWPLAYVAQDGAESLPIPDDCVCVFIGGSTEWKESTEAVRVIQRAQAMGKMIHIGRVNSWRRYELFMALSGSEQFTFDGTKIRYEGREGTLSLWEKYQNRDQAKRQLALPGFWKWGY